MYKLSKIFGHRMAVLYDLKMAAVQIMCNMPKDDPLKSRHTFLTQRPVVHFKANAHMSVVEHDAEIRRVPDEKSLVPRWSLQMMLGLANLKRPFADETLLTNI